MNHGNYHHHNKKIVEDLLTVMNYAKCLTAVSHLYELALFIITLRLRIVE